MKEVAQDVQKALRSFEFEPASFEGLKGTIADNITQRQHRITEIEHQLADAFKTATEIATERLKLEILADHYHNFLVRKQTQSTAPATDSTIFFEGWVKKKDYPQLVKLLEPFDGADIAPIEPPRGKKSR
jgi:vacuolar-type H+-ATPase subunit I/STV1